MTEEGETRLPVLMEREGAACLIRLNRPEALNSLTLEMVRLVREAVDQASVDPSVRLLVFCAKDERGFCAGGDIKSMARAVREGRSEAALRFLSEEYDLDLLIHRFPKPIVVLAHGITMGGGLGLAAGADLILVNEGTRMAMPETRIGFFPDVGATGWLFSKCPPGWPEYLALTGYELAGAECRQVGLATHFVPQRRWEGLEAFFIEMAPRLPGDRADARRELFRQTRKWAEGAGPRGRGVDTWLRNYFEGRTDVQQLLVDLKHCSLESERCEGVFDRIAARSPTAVALTLRLLRRNEGKPMEEVFANDLRAARFVFGHPDFSEGVRARLIDRDDRPRWHPGSFEDLVPESIDF